MEPLRVRAAIIQAPEIGTPEGVTAKQAAERFAPPGIYRCYTWFVSDAATAAEPWLPTVAEQDAAWWELHGEAQQIQANINSFARGFLPH